MHMGNTPFPSQISPSIGTYLSFRLLPILRLIPQVPTQHELRILRCLPILTPIRIDIAFASLLLVID